MKTNKELLETLITLDGKGCIEKKKALNDLLLRCFTDSDIVDEIRKTEVTFTGVK